MTAHRAAGFFMAMLIAGPALAQEQAVGAALAPGFVDASNGISLEQAIDRALAKEPSLRSARSQIAVAEAMRMQASLRPNPSVMFERREQAAGSDNQTMVSVAWPLDLFRRSPRVAVADREVETARLASADRERLLAADVRMRYGELAAAVRDLGLLDELVATLDRQRGLLQSRVELGASPPLERDLLDVEIGRMRAERLLQAGRAESALIDLKSAIGMAPGDALTVRDTLEELVAHTAAGPSGQSAAADVASRPDVREAAVRIDVADARIARARSEARPDLSVVGGYMRMDAGFAQRGVGPDGSLTPVAGLFQYATAGAMITIPLRNRNQGDVAAARAERDGAALAYEAAKLAAEAELAAARVRDERARQAVGAYTTGARELARRNLRVVGQSYDLGRLTVFDVLAEQRRYLEVERALTETLRSAFEARTALTRALGELR